VAENPPANNSYRATLVNTTPAIKPPKTYWIVSALAVLWMLFGVVAWVMDLMSDEASLAQLSEGQRQLYAARPQWLFVVYGVAIFSGLAGAIALLLRSTWATALFAVSLVAIIVQFGYTFLAMHAVEVIGAAAAIPFPLVIFLIGVALLWFARYSRKSGWTKG
jgi:hypothetical protein